MKKKVNKFVTVLLALVLFVIPVLTLPSNTAYAASEYTSKFMVDGTVYGIIGKSKNVILLDFNDEATEIDLTQKVKYNKKSYTITEIGAESFWCSNINSINITNNIKEIGDSAFYYCKNLTTVVISEGITAIYGATFKFCDNLTSVSLPNSLKHVSYGAFFKAPVATVKDGVYIVDDKIVIGFSRDTPDNVIIPEGIIGIADSDSLQYLDPDSFTSIQLPSTLRFIGAYNFSHNKALTQINFPDSLESIGINAFESTNLQSVSLPNKVTQIPDNTFNSCKNLTKVRLGNKVSSIGSNAFSECTLLSDAKLPNSLKAIGYSGFASCPSLTSITLGKNITSLGTGVFSNSYSLNKVVFLGKLPKIYTDYQDKIDLFAGCDNLKKIYVPAKYASAYKKFFQNMKVVSMK